MSKVEHIEQLQERLDKAEITTIAQADAINHYERQVKDLQERNTALVESNRRTWKQINDLEYVNAIVQQALKILNRRYGQ